MIYCPKCKTANRDGSRFCSECGEKLGTQTSPKCPECGALNPVQNLFCSECGARLFSPPVPSDSTPAAPSFKGLSLPTKPPQVDEVTSDESEPDPDLMEGSEVPEDWDSLTGETEGMAQEESLPDWLRDLRASLPAEGVPFEDDEGSGEPEELRAFPVPEQEREPEFGPEPDSGKAPDWLVELQAAATGEPFEGHFEPDDEEIGEAPAWLAQLRTAGLEPVPADDAPVDGAPAGGASMGGAAEAAEEEMSDWLAATQPEEPPSEPELAKEEMPDWLAQLRVAEPDAVPLDSEPEATEEEIPEWLATVHADQEPEAGEIEEEELPDWLAQLRATEPEAVPVDSEPEATEEEIPEWLATVHADQDPEAGEIEAEDLPDWLAQLRAAEPDAAPADVAPPDGEPEIVEEELPDWLREFQAGEEQDRTVGAVEEPTLAAQLGEVDEAPPKAVDLAPEQESARILAEDSGEPAIGSLAPPDWLTALAAPIEEEALPEEIAADAETPEWLAPRVVGAGDTLEKAAIPEWLLALKPQAPKTERNPGSIPGEEEAAEETGLLAGVKGALPAEMLIVSPRAAQVRERQVDEIEGTPQSRLFAQVVSQPPSITPKTLSRREPAALSTMGRWLIALLLIAAVALPLLLNRTFLPRAIEPAAATEALYKSIDALGPGEAVLLSFDYDPTTSGEMDVVARALIEHLVERQARLAAVSLLPAGPATAQSLLEELVAEDQYANLGYIPGQMAAVRLLARSWDTATGSDWHGAPLSDLKALEGVSDLADFALVIELAASQDTLRWWIEQAGEPYELRLGAGVSAAIDPVARSYYETNAQQLVGVVGGVMGAAAYDVLANGQDASSGTFAARLDAHAAGTLVLILVLVLGNIAYLFRRPKGEERG